jgi:predicted extracellular nuclease
VNIKVGTFNVLNLARPGVHFYPDDPPYSQAEFDKKADWIGEQLRRMDADLVGFQEVHHEDALQPSVPAPAVSTMPPWSHRARTGADHASGWQPV